MKIGIITERMYPFYNGGSEKVMYDYASVLSEQYSLSVFTSIDTNASFNGQNNPALVRILPKVNSSNREGNHSLIWIFLYSLSLVRHRRSISNFDLIILDTIHYFYPDILLRYLKKNNKKIATVFHEAWYDYRKSSSFPAILSLLQGIFIRRLIKCSDAMLSVSNPTTRSLINNYKVNQKKIFTVPLSVDYGHIHGKFKTNPLTQRHYDIVFVGRFAKIKRIDDLVSAVKIVRQQRVDIKVALIGDGPLKNQIKNQINSLDLEKNIELFGYLDDARKLEILNDSMIFALPSEREGFSLATLEAMTLGCVPVVSKPPYDEIFGVSHFVKDRINGVYYNSGDITGLADSILFLLDHPDQLYEYSINAQETAKLFDTKTMKKNIFETVEEILS